MKLGKYVEMVLGTVLDANDPKRLGRVRVGAPGYFDRTVMSIEAIPWVYPLIMSGMQSSSTMAIGSKVWLIANNENEEEYWYLPFHELNEDTKEAAGENVASDVLLSRNICGKKLQIYQNENEGIVIKNADSIITLNNDGSIIASTGEDGGVFKIEGKNFYCGGEGQDWEPMVLGNKLNKLLSELTEDVGMTATAASSSSQAMVEPLQQMMQHLRENIKDILSERCNLTK